MSPAVASLRADSPATARAAVESLLRDRKLDRTLTTARPLEALAPGVPFQVQTLDTYLQGGLPAGQLSEVVGPASSGRTSLVWQWMAAATRRGDTVALIDTFDRFDPASAVACGIVLERVLWVRGQAISKTAGAVDPVWLPGVRTVEGPGTMVERTLDRALKALNLVLQSGVCPAVVIDMADVPSAALRRIPYTTWLRVQRVIEGSDTTCVLLAPESLARSAGGVTLTLQTPESAAPAPAPIRAAVAPAMDTVTTRVAWQGASPRARRFDGLRFEARVASSRRQMAGRVALSSAPRTDRLWAER
jgi:recA bacterial DNA recombination protein